MAGQFNLTDAVELFLAHKETLVRQNNDHQHDGKQPVKASQMELIAEKAFAKIVRQDTLIDPAEPFMLNRHDYPKSNLFRLIQRMPKGAHLHLHNFAAANFHKFAQKITETTDLYVFLGSGSNEILYGSFHWYKTPPLSADYKATTACDPRFIYSLVTLPETFGTPEEEKSFKKDRWKSFQECWGRIMNIVHAIPFYTGRDSFFYTLLEDQYATGVRYLELRTTAGEVYHNCFEKATAREYLLAVKETVDLFKTSHKDFMGCKMVFASLKLQSNEEIHSHVLQAIDFHSDPMLRSVFAGFDLVGHEDGLRPISDYIEQLILCQQHKVPLLLHAGETNDVDNFQLYDAVLLGTKRLGHAFDLINHPLLMDTVKKQGIAIECCPISNQGLGYVGDLRNHNAKSLLRHGLKVTISADDPGMFHYCDVSCDFTVATKAWGLKLRDLKRLVDNSFSAACLEESEIERLRADFNIAWDNFISSIAEEEEA